MAYEMGIWWHAPVAWCGRWCRVSLSVDCRRRWWFFSSWSLFSVLDCWFFCDSWAKCHRNVCVKEEKWLKRVLGVLKSRVVFSNGKNWKVDMSIWIWSIEKKLYGLTVQNHDLKSIWTESFHSRIDYICTMISKDFDRFNHILIHKFTVVKNWSII